MKEEITVSVEQIRAARAYKGWQQAELAERSGLSKVTINHIEQGKSRAAQKSLLSIVEAFEEEGIEFVENGVRLRQDYIKFFEEKDSYLKVLDDVYFTLRESKEEVLFFGSDERRSPTK